MYFYVGELVQCVEHIVEEHSDGSEVLLTKVYGFLAAMFLEHGTFKFMRHFKDIFPKLHSLGAAATGAGKLVTLVAEAPCDKPAQLNLSNVDVADRNYFRETRLWAT